MSEYKYTLIVSQFYHSYHVFIVKFDEDKYWEQMRNLTKKLCEYKRGTDKYFSNKSLECGDPYSRKKEKEPCFRYNVNDYGDIYFLNFISVNDALDAAKKYFDYERTESRGYKRKSIQEEISKCHDKNKILEIIESIYEIA